ncbi:hypothetical protein HK405_010450, partial [Cladochytrium tenue]
MLENARRARRQRRADSAAAAAAAIVFDSAAGAAEPRVSSVSEAFSLTRMRRSNSRPPAPTLVVTAV